MEDEWLLLQVRDFIVGKYSPKTWDILVLRLGIDGEEPQTLDEIQKPDRTVRYKIETIDNQFNINRRNCWRHRKRGRFRQR